MRAPCGSPAETPVRIRLLIGVGIGLALVASIVLVTAIRSAASAETRLDQFQMEVARISRDSATLLVLSQDYLLHSAPRAARQWRTVHEQLTASLAALRGREPSFDADIVALERTVAGLPRLFDDIVSTSGETERERYRPRMEMLSSSLLAETRRISDSAFDLDERLIETRRNLRDAQHRAILITLVAFVALMLALGAVVWQRVLRPIHRLQRTAAAVEAGDLSARAGYVVRDEFGDLARVVDTMIGALESRTRQAEHASAAKTRFLANTSHEIRTPLHAIIGLSRLLARTALDRRQHELVDKVRLSGDALLQLLDDVLDLSKVEAGELALERVPFAPYALCTQVMAMLRVQAEARGIALSLKAGGDLPDIVEGDPVRLRQVLVNLVANAIKFTPQGEVTLSVEVPGHPDAGAAAAGGNRVALRFAVTDSGIGIPEDRQALVFEPFSQADGSTRRRFGGTGLGLSIVRHFVGLMGGTISVHSRPGEGSVFTVDIELPRASTGTAPIALEVPAGASPAAPPRASGAPAPLAGLELLVVDDNEINRQVAAELFEAEGARVATANDAAEALRLLDDGPQRFAAVLMDVQMPGMDGCEATRILRTRPALRRLPVIAVTAGALSSERDRALASGMDAFIGKPFEPAAAVACIVRLVRDARRGNDDSDPAPATARAASAAAASGASAAPAGDTAPGRGGAVAGWPSIEGIDGIDVAEARRFLGADPDRIRRLLLRWAERPVDVPASLPEPAPADLPEWAARLHRLRGAVAGLGARDLARVAAEAEATCGSGDAVAARVAIARAGAAEATLRNSVLASLRPQPVAATQSSAPQPRAA
jgi:signal transduction histidine kinase/CheY-like chemotaxis protein